MFDFDVDNDGIPDQLYGYRADTSGRLIGVDINYLNFTTYFSRNVAGTKRPTL